jgi:MFS family permease
MQRIAQDWLVLTHLTPDKGLSVGVVMALQFGPGLLLLPLTGFAADHLDRRKVLLTTQALMAALALGLGIVTLTGVVRLWQVNVFAALLGCVTAFDAPARQTFVAELAGEANLSSAVGLNSTSFNAARMIGPAIAGALIAAVGSGWIFIINAGSFLAVLGALLFLRPAALHPRPRAPRAPGGLAEGFRYVWARTDLKSTLLMLFIIGAFGLNFPIFLSTMSVSVFHVGAGGFGVLTAVMAAGSVIGALITANWPNPQSTVLIAIAALFGLSCAAAAISPGFFSFALALVCVGVAAQTFTTATNSYVQISTSPELRGRVVAILLAIALGGTPLGAPIAGWVADRFGPRWALGVAAASGALAAALGALMLRRSRIRQTLPIV